MDTIKMKPFDLEAAKRGEPLVTRDGREAKFIAHVPELGENNRVVVLIEGRDAVVSLNENGCFSGSGLYTVDLFMAPVKQKVCTIVYKNPFNGQKFIESYTTSFEKEAAINSYSVYNWEVVAVFENEYEEE